MSDISIIDPVRVQATLTENLAYPTPKQRKTTAVNQRSYSIPLLDHHEELGDAGDKERHGHQADENLTGSETAFLGQHKSPAAPVIPPQEADDNASVTRVGSPEMDNHGGEAHSRGREYCFVSAKGGWFQGQRGEPLLSSTIQCVRGLDHDVRELGNPEGGISSMKSDASPEMTREAR